MDRDDKRVPACLGRLQRRLFSPARTRRRRRRAGDGWEAYVATLGESSVLVTWEKAAALHPVRDDRPSRA